MSNWYESDAAAQMYSRQAESYNKRVGHGECDKCHGKGMIAVVNRVEMIYQLCLVHCPDCRGGLGVQSDPLGEFSSDNVWQAELKKKAMEYLDEGGAPWFYVGGQVGSGKTHICMGLLQKFKGSVFYWNIEAARMKGLDGDQELINRYQRAEVLLIDDLFCGTVTPGDLNLARQIIDYRYNNNLRTIITSEKQYVELRNDSEGIASRIVEKTVNGRYCISLKHDRAKDYRRRD